MSSPDVVVLGAGVIGSSIALRLAQKGLTPLVVDPNRPGHEASRASGGILAPQSESTGPGPAFDLDQRSYALFQGLAEELKNQTGVDIGLRRCGVFWLAFSEADEEMLHRRFDWQRSAGFHFDVLGKDAARRAEPALSERVRCAFHFVNEGQLDPGPFTDALVDAASAAGARFRVGARAQKVLREGNRISGVVLDGEVVATERVVVCAGAWASLIDGLGVPSNLVQPVRGQMVLLEAHPAILRSIAFGPRGYVVPRPDGRILCGSTLENVGFEKGVTADGVLSILGSAREAIPALGSLPILGSWSGFRPATHDSLPAIGSLGPDGLWMASGHYRSGILLAPITAEIVASLVAEGKAPFDISAFSPLRRVAGAGSR